jgi:hypothetical protein
MQIQIDLEYLLSFLNKVYVWSPKDSYIRNEIGKFMDELKRHRPQ